MRGFPNRFWKFRYHIRMRTIAPTRFQRGLTDLQTIALVLIGVVAAGAIAYRINSHKVDRDDGAREVSYIKQAGLAVIMYTNDYDDMFPPDMSSNAAIKSVTIPYCKDNTIFATLNPNGGEITGNHLLGGRTTTEVENPMSTPMLLDSKPWPDGSVAVDFADGHGKTEPNDELQQQLAVPPFAKSSDSKSP